MSSYRHDVFLSYAHEDRDTAVALVRALEAEHLKVWFDDKLEIGDRLTERIDHALKSSRFGVVLVTPVSIRKPWIYREMGIILGSRTSGGRKVLLPVLYGIHPEEVEAIVPDLKNLKAASMSLGFDAVARMVGSVVRKDRRRIHAWAGPAAALAALLLVVSMGVIARKMLLQRRPPQQPPAAVPAVTLPKTISEPVALPHENKQEPAREKKRPLPQPKKAPEEPPRKVELPAQAALDQWPLAPIDLRDRHVQFWSAKCDSFLHYEGDGSVDFQPWKQYKTTGRFHGYDPKAVLKAAPNDDGTVSFLATEDENYVLVLHGGNLSMRDRKSAPPAEARFRFRKTVSPTANYGETCKTQEHFEMRLIEPATAPGQALAWTGSGFTLVAPVKEIGFDQRSQAFEEQAVFVIYVIKL